MASQIILKIILISIGIGLLSGVSSTLFLHSLNWVTDIRQHHTNLIFALPVFGFIFGKILKKIPPSLNRGVAFLINQLKRPQDEISPWMAPFIFITSLGTHFFGGSAGREGVGVIMGASCAQFFVNKADVIPRARSLLIYAGIAAGFASLFGTPLAGIIFSFELNRFKEARNSLFMLSTTLSAFMAYFISLRFGPTHQAHPIPSVWTLELGFYIGVAALVAAAAGGLFHWSLNFCSHRISKILPQPEWKLLGGGLLILAIVILTQGYPFMGLSLDVLEKSFHSPMEFTDFSMKFVLTVLTLAIGLKGGEVTPLFVMGATLNNFVSGILGLTQYALSSALGMVSLFGALAGTPWAAGLMGAELFGWPVGWSALLSSLLARKLLASRNIYE